MLTAFKPASRFAEACPIGNGKLGAMIYGGLARERILLNQDSIWYGGSVDRINPDAREHLQTLRKHILAGNIKESHKLLEYAFSGTPQSQRPYQPLGWAELCFRFDERELVYGERSLDPEQAIVTETLLTKEGDEAIRKEYFASAPEDLIVVRIRALCQKISLSVLLTRERYYDRAGKIDDSGIFMDGTLGSGGVYFCVGIRAEAMGGCVRVLGEHLLVEEADEITLYIACGTSFYEEHPFDAMKSRLEAASRNGSEAVRKAHIADWQSYYNRMKLKIEGEGNTFAEEYFRFARYLLLSCSRPGSLPANLQGIWNDQMLPPWDSKYTININTEMNYWIAESANLSECHLPLFEHLKRMHANGHRTAEKMYGCRGFVAHHNTDIWGDCAPQDIYLPASYWVMGGAWLCTHIWNHYIYTLDRDFLRDMFPILRDAVLFFTDFLIEDRGEYVTCPSVSPENVYLDENGEEGCITAGASMDSQLVRDLMNVYLLVSDVLGEEDPLIAEAKNILEKLPAIRIGRHGQIMEWRNDYEEAEPGHRHISQLYALYPSHQISLRKTPDLSAAARRTIDRRLRFGGGHTGWSCAWLACLYARLCEGDLALQMLEKLWKESTFPNMMDSHPLGEDAVFQIDGNMGAAAAMLELLVQTEEQQVFLLPALPEQWESGEITGLCIPGGAQLDLEWEAHRLCFCRVYASTDYSADFIYQNEHRHLTLRKGDVCEL